MDASPRKTSRSDPQRAELEAAGCEKIFIDHGVSSRIRDRPEWLALLEYARSGDVLVVRKLDRLAGTGTMMLGIAGQLEELGVDLRSLMEPQIDTTSAMGRAFFGFAAVLAQLRVDSIRENTMAGLAYARSQGRIGGRPSVMTDERTAQALCMREVEELSFRQIARVLGVGESSVRRALAALDLDEPVA
ncbi:recombinase family protein [Paenarthrobacter sp. Z7-10]|uniref:recombinase family protein n=1 Tax=Paenarthrobacter sp. Z7-10 TaxID=2787635 RepID=UPI0022A8F1D3|nr:recombinase family protein [Paenarthrobacter sp. Z7-10]